MPQSKYLQPRKYFYFIVKKIEGIFSNLENNGERLDIFSKPEFLLNDNEKCHMNRYLLASSILKKNEVVGDFACGTGYGSAVLAPKVKSVLGIDIDREVVEKVRSKYKDIHNLSFRQSNLLEINFTKEFDTIISFETIEHLEEKDISRIFELFNVALKEKGRIIFSTPYMQKNDEVALKMGFHKTFFIDESKITKWMHDSNFKIVDLYYQSYSIPEIVKNLNEKDFIICIAQKI